MQHHLTTLRRRRAEGDHGFTLIELLVVVVIIGILIAIAIPVYLNYQKGAKDKSAASDLRNAVAVLEQCNSDNSGYPSALTPGTGAAANTYTMAATGTTTPCAQQTINVSGGTTLTYYATASGAAAPGYIISGSNSGGSANRNYCYDSLFGGSVKTEAAAATAALLPTGCA